LTSENLLFFLSPVKISYKSSVKQGMEVKFTVYSLQCTVNSLEQEGSKSKIKNQKSK